jgi:hypothetical protein
MNPWNLELLQTIDRPDGLENARWHGHVSPDRADVALMCTDDAFKRYRLYGGGLDPVGIYPVPKGQDRLAVAFHPSSPRVALTTPTGVRLMDPGGRVSVDVELERDAVPRAVAFDRGGEHLLVSCEGPRGRSFLHMVDGRKLQPLYTVDVGGEAESYHYLHLHPEREVVAVEVSCGQDGTWLTFVEYSPSGLHTLPRGLQRPGEPFMMAGFDPDGRRFAVTRPLGIDLLAWPACNLVRTIEPGADHQLFDWCGAWVGRRLVASVLDVETEDHGLLVTDNELVPLAIQRWERGDQDWLFDLKGLSDGRLLVLGDRRAGLFRTTRAY